MLPNVSYPPPVGFQPGKPTVHGFNTQIEESSVRGASQVFYVDSAHAGANDGHPGTDPNYPLENIQELMDRATGVSAVTPALGDYDVIYVSGDVAETVVTGDSTEMPVYVSVIGGGSSPHSPTWTAATAAGTALTLRCEGWSVVGFTFEVGAAGTAIQLAEVPGSDYISYKTTISNCKFDGLWGGLYGVDFSGAPHRVVIENCEFLEFRRGDTTAYAIIVSDSTHTSPYECHIRNNLFWENENHIGGLGAIRGFNMSVFTGNAFHIGELIAATLMLDLRGGSRGNNFVTGNFFQGDYSNVGGYWAHAGDPGMWVGNYAEDLLEAEVGDNGITVGPPS